MAVTLVLPPPMKQPPALTLHRPLLTSPVSPKCKVRVSHKDQRLREG